MSFDCEIDKRDPNSIDRYNFKAGESEFRIIYIKLILMSFIPLLIGLATVLFWWIVLKRKG